MDFVNSTKMVAGYTIGMQPDGRELLVVVVKGTFTIPQRRGDSPRISAEQVPLFDADTFTGDPGFSSPVYESDFSPFKRRCDVLLNGSAYSPLGRPVERVKVSLRVGSMIKSFDVVGERSWRNGFGGMKPGSPKLFTRMPISYDLAFGGLDSLDPDLENHRSYAANPVGRGFYDKSAPALFEGRPLPCSEETDRPVLQPNGTYRPMAFGPLGRSWHPRLRWAGTYDEVWKDKIFPFLPADFDDQYYQAAPADQQIDYIQGGEQVVLTSLTAAGSCSYALPKLSVPVTFFLTNREVRELKAVADTLVIEPDRGRFMVSWRASLPLRRNVFEVAQAVAGKMSAGWYRARQSGKSWHPSIQHFIEYQRNAAAETTEQSVEEDDE